MRTGIAFLATLLLLASAPAARSDEAVPPAAGTTGSVGLGFWTSSLSGSPDLASEFEPADRTRPDLRLELDTLAKGGRLQVESSFKDTDWQQHLLRFDVGRWLRSSTTYKRFLARQGHDPMTDLEAASRNGRIVWNTDLDPGAVYEHSHGVLEHRTEIQPRALSALTLGVTLRDQRRSGAHQGMIISHCDTCHVYSQSHPLDEKQSEAGLDARLAWNGGQLAGSFAHRQLRQDRPSLTLLYDRALHPELRTPIFDNRVVFDRLEGPQQVDRLQDVDRELARADLTLHDLLGFRASAGGTWSRTRNRFTTLETESSGYDLALSRGFRKKGNLRLRGRTYRLSSDEWFVDTPERVGTAGPQANRSYRQIYGFDPDYTRRSGLDRDVLESSADLSWRLGRKAGSLRGLWTFRSVDRDHVQVAAGDTTTTTSVLGLSWRAHPAKDLKLSAEYRHGFVDDPYVLVDGACATIPAISVPSPLAPGSVQYFQVHEARVAETTATPEDWNELKLGATLSGPRATLTANWRYWDGSNQSGDLTDWSRRLNALTATLWTAPTPRWDAYVAYTWQTTELGSHVCVPVFDG